MSENNKIAHCLESKVRTKDVILEENISFKSLLLPENILRGLSDAGFEKPSPIQLKAVPVGRCGFDLTIKSKSGTGKTLVFGIIALEAIKLEKNDPQVLIIVPTREIAVQIQDVLRNIGKYLEGLSIQSFIGGLPINWDKVKCKPCHIAVGTPGRVKQLIQDGHLATDCIRSFVLDEADKLMEDSFQNDINEIFNSLPRKKQVIMCSATYPNELQNFLSNYMLSPTFVSAELETPLLLGLKQFVRILHSPPNIVQQTKVKNEELLKILSTVSFTQSLIFSNYQTKAESISNFLNRNGWHSAFISAAQNQTERLSSMSSLKDFKCRILISTDLTSRGIDASNVDLVINYDIPVDAMTYLHRMGRAGRYGSTGTCINLSLAGQETKLLQNILGIIGGPSLSMPILDDSLTTIVSKDNVLVAEVPDNIKEVDVASVLGQLAAGTLEFDTTTDNDKEDNRMDIFYNELLPSPPKITAEDEDCKNRIEENNSEVDPENNSISILQQLSQEGTILEVGKEKTKEKKRKRSQSYANTSPGVVLNEGEIFCKNKALFSVAKSLSNVEMCKKDVDCLSEYLTKLKHKGKLETPSVLKNNENDTEDTIKKLDLNEDNQKEHFKVFLENIFSCAYRSQVIGNCNSWQHYLPEEEKKKLKENYNTPNWNECDELDEEDCDEENYNEYDEEYGEDEEYDEDYDFEMEKEIQVNFSENVKNNTSQDPHDFSFMKWIPVGLEQSSQKGNKIITPDDKICPSEHSTSSEQSSKKTVDIFTQPSTAVTPISDSYHEQFGQYYQHCSNNLWQRGLSLDTVANFDEWFFYDWQSQVATVRNFVQKKIYMEEMRRYEDECNRKQDK